MPYQYSSPASVIIEAIAQSPEELEIFSQCRWDFKPREWIVDAPTQELFNAVQVHLETIARAAFQMKAESLIIACKGIALNTFETRLVPVWMRVAGQPKVPLIHRLDDDRPIAVIRMSDNKGLFCTQELGRLEKCNPNDYIGADIRQQYNVPGAFEQYISDLETHKFLDDYSLPVLNALGHKKQQRLRAWLSKWRGEDVRVVQVLWDEEENG